MTPFLKQVASHWFNYGNLESKCFVFPNRRSLVFFRKYLSELVSEKPVLLPELVTINELFQKCSGNQSADRIHLLLVLYDCYRKLNPEAESLDDFVFWGNVILSDFDDVDKYLVNPAYIFTNVSDFKAIQDTYSYLEPSQLDAIDRFASHFKSRTSVKADFLKIWEILGELYDSFNASLLEQKLSREGYQYRQLAENEESISDILKRVFPDVSEFVFVGLNALSTSEKQVLRRMRDAKLAHFCWDYCGRKIKAPQNKSSLFLSDNVIEFPQAIKLEKVDESTEFEAISVPSATGQVKMLSQILSGISNPGLETAIVLPDETKLLPVLNSIPSGITRLNVTMGCPMTSSSIWSLMDGTASLKLNMTLKDGKYFFYHKDVWSILSNGLLKEILSNEEEERIREIRKASEYYVPASSFELQESILPLIFRPLPDDIRAIEAHQQKLISALASRIKDDASLALELDFARDYYLAVGRLMNYELEVKPSTYFRLLRQIASGYSVPFKGEPLNGLQIMGPLETRALDFENVIILDANEGTFPRHSVFPSLIPPELRKGFGLPTYEFQDAVWAYYFYRLVSRAKKVTMIFDSRTDMGSTGEESRYIRQLEMDFGVRVNRKVAHSPVSMTESEKRVAKTEQDILELKIKPLSASALQNYLSCPLKFYYHSVKRLKAPDEISEVLDSGMIGSSFHKTMELLYGGRKRVERSYLSSLLEKGNNTIASVVKSAVLEQIKCIDLKGRNLIKADIISSYVRKAVERDIELMNGYGVDFFTLFGTEKVETFSVSGYDFIGYIDRLDSLRDNEVRIVDYKTGKVTDEDFDINDGNAETVIEKLFSKESKSRPKIALQLYLYDLAVSQDSEFRGRTLVNSIYQTSNLFKEKIRNVALCDKFKEMMKINLDTLMAEISDTSVDWVRTEDGEVCKYCDFKTLCGR